MPPHPIEQETVRRLEEQGLRVGQYLPPDWDDPVEDPNLFPAYTRILPPEDSLSYRNPTILATLVKDYPDIPLKPGMNCPLCREYIPYSIHKIHYYCFNCHYYFHWREGVSELSTPRGTISRFEGPGWVVGHIKDPADLYTLTLIMLTLGHPYEILREEKSSLLNGFVLFCRGEVKFFTSEDIDKDVELVKIRNFHNSVESAVEIYEITQTLPPKRQLSYSPTELTELFEAYERRRLKKEQAHG